MKQCEIAVYGLGVMGSSLAKNMISHGFSVAAYSKSQKERECFLAPEGRYQVCDSVEEMLGALKSPRCIFLMITAGRPVDMVLEELAPLLEPGDVILDGGNSYYKDTSRRYAWCEEKGICYVGVGVSGGELGALYGPSMMAGGSLEGWEKTRHILQTIAAHVGETPCCDYIAREGAGHFVKMVHNGIEYAILQLIAETYYFMKQVLDMPYEEILSCFEVWQKGRLDSYLIDISVKVLRKRDEDGSLLVEKILDVAQQKGTGKWTLLESVERGVYIPTIYEAVSARNFSGKKQLRHLGKEALHTSGRKVAMENAEKVLGDALLAGIILCYSQGLELIAKASKEEQWEIDLGALMDVWRDGCIIRSKLLGEIKKAEVTEDQPLLLSDVFGYLKELEPSLRQLSEKAVASGAALPGMASALHYYDYYRMDPMPVNFIQALRDCFGAHTYQRVDKEGSFHTKWEE
ncbi:MAG: NADP-dependent phosphogluconate dehydrogenase [Blautia sp.]|jgi:6-phosphogluconate dehydrogenase